jgi:integration host factor subunit alpha
MSLTKDHIVNSIRARLDLPKTKSAELFESVLEIIKATLENREDVLISGFGKFSAKEKGNRRGRNPQTGEDLTLESRRVISFRCSPVLRDKINEKVQHKKGEP